MKNIFTILMLFCSVAQLNISFPVETGPKKLIVGHISNSYLYKVGNGYEYWTKTDDPFDQTYSTIYLGDSVESAIATLNNLKSLMENKVAMITIPQIDGNITLTYQKILGVDQLWIRQERQAGKAWISIDIVNKFLKYFEELQNKTL